MLVLRKCQTWSALGFKGVRNKTTTDNSIYCEKYWIKQVCGKADFLPIRHFFVAETGKASSESWEKRESFCISKTFSCNGWTAMWFPSYPKMTGQTKKPYFDPMLDYPIAYASLTIYLFTRLTEDLQELWAKGGMTTCRSI